MTITVQVRGGGTEYIGQVLLIPLLDEKVADSVVVEQMWHGETGYE